MQDFYDKNSKQYIEETKNCDMSLQYNLFEKHLSKNAKVILDLGFGSGRDSLYFQKTYEVYSIDPSLEFCKNAPSLGLKQVYNLTAQNMPFREMFDGIWACSSLLHIKREELGLAFEKCYQALKHNGIMYCSFKYGLFEGYRGERYFLDQTEETILAYLKNTNFQIVETLITSDVRAERSGKWLNLVLKKIK